MSNNETFGMEFLEESDIEVYGAIAGALVERHGRTFLIIGDTWSVWD